MISFIILSTIIVGIIYYVSEDQHKQWSKWQKIRKKEQEWWSKEERKLGL